jgi:hypothetical protein
MDLKIGKNGQLINPL